MMENRRSMDAYRVLSVQVDCTVTQLDLTSFAINITAHQDIFSLRME